MEVVIDSEAKYTMTSLRDWLNENFMKEIHGKRDNEKFCVGDVQGYIRRGYLPSYIKPGSKIVIEKVLDLQGAKIYGLKEERAN